MSTSYVSSRHWALDIWDPIYLTQKNLRWHLIDPFFRGENEGLGKSSDLTKVTQPVRGGSGVRVKVCLLSELQSHSQDILQIPEYSSLSEDHKTEQGLRGECSVF